MALDKDGVPVVDERLTDRAFEEATNGLSREHLARLAGQDRKFPSLPAGGLAPTKR